MDDKTPLPSLDSHSPDPETAPESESAPEPEVAEYQEPAGPDQEAANHSSPGAELPGAESLEAEAPVEEAAPVAEAPAEEVAAPAAEAEDLEAAAPAAEAQDVEAVAPVAEAQDVEAVAPAAEAQDVEAVAPVEEAPAPAVEAAASAAEAQDSVEAAPSVEAPAAGARDSEEAAPAAEAKDAPAPGESSDEAVAAEAAADEEAARAPESKAQDSAAGDDPTAGVRAETQDTSAAPPTITAPPAENAPEPAKSPSSKPASELAFTDLALPDFLLEALDEVGYENPSPIQAGAIPPLLEGRDMLGQAQTGTGKTAAFALPLLARLDPGAGAPQVLVLTPTRELAIQVAEAFQRYASKMRGFRVLPIYGGQGYDRQLHQLRRGVHVIVGTPGRVMDHMRRGTLELGSLKTLVLDEADEMLRMGFREDVEWILGHTPPERQIALFSATLPPVIRRIAGAHMQSPEEVRVKRKSATAETIRQRYWLTRGVHKLDALTRMLEVEPFDGMIVFVRTKSATVELAEKLAARGFRAAPMNGDMAQGLREQTVNKMEKGRLDILVATDVAARGLDLERVSHVVNFDIPYDTDSYVHRVGRTGRAGRQGEAILFVAPRERRMLSAIEQVTRTRIERMELPSVSDVNDSRVARFEEKLTATLEAGVGKEFQALLEGFQTRHDVPGLEIAAALATMLQGNEPFLLKERPPEQRRPERGDQRSGRGGGSFDSMVRYRVSIGRVHGVGPGDLVGAIAGETGLEGRRIGRIDLREDHSFVELPAGMPADIQRHLQTVRVRGQAMEIKELGPVRDSGDRRDTRPRRAGDMPRSQPPSAVPRRRGGPGGGPGRGGNAGFNNAGGGPGRGGNAGFNNAGGFGQRKRTKFKPEGPGKGFQEPEPERRQGRPEKSYGPPSFKPPGPAKSQRFQDDAGRGGRPDAETRTPRPEPGSPRADKPRSVSKGESAPQGKRSQDSGHLDLEEPRRIAKPRPQDGAGEGENAQGSRRTGKKARWSKARKRAAKKTKGKS